MANSRPPPRRWGCYLCSLHSRCAGNSSRRELLENRLILGEPDGSRSKRTTDIATLLRGGGMSAAVAPRIRDAVWAKLIQNLAASAMALLAGMAVDDIYREPSAPKRDAVSCAREKRFLTHWAAGPSSTSRRSSAQCERSPISRARCRTSNVVVRSRWIVCSSFRWKWRGCWGLPRLRSIF